MPRRPGCSLLTALLVLPFLFASPQFAAAAPPQSVDVLIAFKNPPGRADEALIRKQGGTVKHTYWIVPAIAARIPARAVAALSRNPNVDIIEPDVTVQADDLELDNVWGVARIGGGIAHDGGYAGAGVRVAVLDTGIDYTHPDLNANYAGGWDFVNGDNDPMDDHGHGTHVAGTIAAADDGYGVVGVAPEAQLYALKVLNSSGSGSFSGIIAALQWCIQNGIQVTNNSYGTPTNPGSTVQQAFDNANAAGIVMVASAGNSGSSAGTGDTVNYPAWYGSVIAVAATTSGDVRASFSSTGPDVELAAPGSSIYSTLRGGGYGYKSGTSMASPHVAGVAAVIIGAGVSDNSDVRLLLAMSSQDLGQTGVDPWYGNGLVDVAAALFAIGTPEPPPPPTDPPSESGIAIVNSIAYSLYGGKRQDKNLEVAVQVIDDFGLPVAGASVAVTITRSGTVVLNAERVTDSNGEAFFTINGARAGTYQTTVVDVSADPLSWDGVTPVNSFQK